MKEIILRRKRYEKIYNRELCIRFDHDNDIWRLMANLDIRQRDENAKID